jgi:2-iminobutanoate/2-iminopropanoate deaminase
MNQVKHVQAPAAPEPDGSFSHAVVAGPFVFVSGQGPFDPATGDIVGTDVGAQTRQVVANLEAILKAAGCSLRDVVKVDAHLEDFDLFEQYDAVYREQFSEPRPARKTVASSLGGILVELDCIALVPGD